MNVSLGGGVLALTGVASTAYQLLYRTNDATGQPVANATTVIVPNGAPPAGGRRLVSLHDAEDSVDPNCAPSYQLQLAQSSNGNLSAESSLVSPMLALGRDVVIPDAEGLKSEYIVAGMEAHAVLDSIRAVERFPAAQLGGSATPVGLTGYSGGGHVTAAADEFAPGYAPELHIVGVAGGGVPPANRETIAYLDGSVGAGVLMATSIGVDRAYPQLDLTSLLNARGKAFAQQVSTGCATSVFAAPFAHFDQYTTVPDSFDLPRVAQVISQNALGHTTPTAPTFFYNAISDELISVKALDKLVAFYCDNGATIDYFRDPSGVEHVQGAANFFPLALIYLNGRFNGDPVPNTCGPRHPSANAPSNSAAPGDAGVPGSGAPRGPGRGGRKCRSGRVITVHPRIPRALTVQRIRVTASGGTVKLTRRAHPRRLRISLIGRAAGTVKIDLRIRGRRDHHAVTIHDRRTYRTCRPHELNV
ncbi:MAG: lipase family protein [Actinomycetota bacterium]|nr:lipase family protein [Actinomycetota bacterium]